MGQSRTELRGLVGAWADRGGDVADVQLRGDERGRAAADSSAMFEWSTGKNRKSTALTPSFAGRGAVAINQRPGRVAWASASHLGPVYKRA